MRKNYSEEQKKEIVQRYRSGEKISSICEDTGISKSTLYQWSKIYKKKSDKELNLTDVRILKQRCEKYEKMVKILQASPCTVKAPLHERYAVISDLSDTYSITLLCETMQVAKGSYYNHILRNANENTSYARKKKEIAPIIEEIFHESHQVFGARKINAILRSRGYIVADKTVSAIMKENGWFSIRGGAKKLYEMAKQRKANILAQNFIATAPNQVWVSDVTYFSFKDDKYYICVILDLFARKVISYSISNSNSTRLTKSTLKKAYYERMPQEGLIFHSDRGANYTSRSFVDYCKTLGITLSLSRTGTPYDNSVMESFSKLLKRKNCIGTIIVQSENSKKKFRHILNFITT